MPKKILLADDSITIQKVVELTFSDGDYEVTAVNNGAKAVQKLAEMRPDIILSDIIMPEKNGYEVCEYVKSHPDFRNIPVVLLTGTFEPFDPDRAEKAGCDAVVTKPFESQSLIHKVEELIAQAQSKSSAAAVAPPAPPAAEAPSPWMDDTASTQDRGSSFSTASGGFPVAAPESFTHDADIFAAAPSIQATTEMPFEVPPTPSFDNPPSFGSDTPFGEEAAPEFGGETRAFPRMTFEEMQKMAAPPAPVPAPSPWDEPAAAPEPDADSPFGAPPPPEEFSSETRAIPRMSLEELQRMAASETAEPPSASPEPSAEAPSAASPWDEQEAPAFGGETRAFPKLNFDDFQHEATTPAPPAESSWDAPAFAPEPTLSAEPTDASPFGSDADAPAFGGETRAFPKLNFDDFQQMTAAPEPEPQPEPSSAWASEPPSQFDAPQSFDAPEPAQDAPPAAPLFESSGASPFDDSASPFRAEPAASTFDEEPSTASQSAWSSELVEEETTEMPSGISDQPLSEDLPFAAEPDAAAEEPAWSLDEYAAEAAEEQVELDEPGAAPAALTAEATPAPLAALAAPDLTNEQVERIARRVVELLSDQIVRNIAWEVIPDLAEMAVKERIRQLEAEA